MHFCAPRAQQHVAVFMTVRLFFPPIASCSRHIGVGVFFFSSRPFRGSRLTASWIPSRLVFVFLSITTILDTAAPGAREILFIVNGRPIRAICIDCEQFLSVFSLHPFDWLRDTFDLHTKQKIDRSFIMRDAHPPRSAAVPSQ